MTATCVPPLKDVHFDLNPSLKAPLFYNLQMQPFDHSNPSAIMFLNLGGHAFSKPSILLDFL